MKSEKMKTSPIFILSFLLILTFAFLSFPADGSDDQKKIVGSSTQQLKLKKQINVQKMLKYKVLKLEMRPDLVINRIWFKMKDEKTGKFNCYAEVKNVGKTEAFIGRGWPLFHANHSGWRSGSWYGFNLSENLRLGPGKTYSCIAENYTGEGEHDPGTHTIRVMVDPKNKVEEANEKNNIKSRTITLQGIPKEPVTQGDLIIRQIRIKPDTATIEGNFEVVITVTNIGGHSLWFRDKGRDILSCPNLDDKQIFNKFEINPGGSKVFRRRPKRLDRGTFTWTIKVDPFNRINEANESNNTKQFKITIR